MKVMKKVPKERSDSDIDQLEKFLFRNQFFQKMKKDCDHQAIGDSFRKLLLVTKAKNDVVFNFGDFGKEFYVILNGRVAVRVPTQIVFKGTNKELVKFLTNNLDEILWRKTENFESLFIAVQLELQQRGDQRAKITPQMIQKMHAIEALEFDDTTIENVVWMLKEVCQFSSGDSFGELASITNKPRSATIICMENTDFAVMDKDSYEKVVGKAMKRKLQD